MKKMIALILAAMMLLMCVPAMAGQGDRTVFHTDNTMERSESPRSVFVGDNCLYVNFYTSNGEIIREYPLDGGAPVDYVLYAYNDDFSLLDYYSMGDDTEAEGEEGAAKPAEKAKKGDWAICPVCGKKFIKKESNQVYDSLSCANRGRRSTPRYGG